MILLPCVVCIEWHCGRRIIQTDITVFFCYQYYKHVEIRTIVNNSVRIELDKQPSHCCDRGGYYCKAEPYPLFNPNLVVQASYGGSTISSPVNDISNDFFFEIVQYFSFSLHRDSKWFRIDQLLDFAGIRECWHLYNQFGRNWQ